MSNIDKKPERSEIEHHRGNPSKDGQFNQSGHNRPDQTPGKQPEPTEPASMPDTAGTIGGWMIAILWVIALGVGTYLAQGWLEKRSERREGVTGNDDRGRPALLLSDNLYGQYRVRGSVNGQDVLFLVDTGASGISIPENVANTLGLRRGRPFDVNTANGTVTVYTTKLESLSVGPLRRDDLRAHINPGMEGETALLGMSFLRDFEIVHRDGEMIIREP